MNVLALTSYDMFKLATHTSWVPLHLNHHVQSRWQCKQYPAGFLKRIIIKFITKEVVIPSEIFTRLQAQFGDECLSQCSVGRNHFEKDETVLKMNLTLGDQELLSIQTTL
jgi:hypothetical protein